jgi:uncharacterized lipoprotein YbaY
MTLGAIIGSGATSAWAGPFVSGGDPTAQPIVTGMVDGFEVPAREAGYTVIIKLVDASFADAPSTTLLKVTYENVKDFPVLFSLSGLREFSQNSTYQIEVLVDADGDGKISKGDYINTSAVGVQPFHPKGYAYVMVREVK